MKSKTLVAICIATISITLISCDWLFGKKQSGEKTKSIVGKWTIDSVADSSKNGKNGMGLLVLALIAKDSTTFTIEFKPDSTYGFFQNNKPLEDSLKYYLDSTVQTLFLNEEASSEDSFSALSIKSWTDSSLQLFSNKDSILYTLNKQ